MVRRVSVAVCLTALLALAFGAAFPTAAPVRLARHPDYHAGKIAFSYLGDIWTASEDGADRRTASPTTSRARSIRASRPTASGSRSRRTATATTTSSWSRRPAARRRRLTFHTGNDDVVGWTRDSQSVIFRVGARRRRVPERRDALSDRRRRRPGEAAAGRLGLLGQLLARRQVARLQPPSRRPGRASTIAAATPPTSGSPTSATRPTRKLLGDEQLQPLLADVGRRQRDLLRRRSAAERQEREAGQPRGAQERQQHLQDPGERAASRRR